jgi:hypothetical protein
VGRLGALVAAAVGLAGPLLLATPAWAARPQVTISQPADQQVVSTTTMEVTGKATQENGYITGDIVFTAEDGHDHKVEVRQTVLEPSSTVFFGADLALQRNGRWSITVAAMGQEQPDLPPVLGQEKGVAEILLVVEAPAAPPEGLKVVLDTDTKDVTVSWDPNSEPDLLRYDVERQSSNDTWAALTKVDAGQPTTATDTHPARNKAGAYSYRVTALRAGSTAEGPAMKSDPTVGALDPSTGDTSSTAAPAGATTSTTTPAGTVPPGGTSTPTSSGVGGSQGLPELDKLLKDRSRSGPAAPRPEGPDPGFAPSLPFAAGAPIDDAEVDDGLGEQAAGDGPVVDEPGPNRTRSLAFFAGGLLATVLLMHALWVRDEVLRAERLDPMPAAPPGPSAGPDQ